MSEQSPSWGAPAGAAWGSPVVRNGAAGRDSPNPLQTPIKEDNRGTPGMNRSQSYPSWSGRPSNSPGRGGSHFTPRHFQPRPRYQSSPYGPGGGTPNSPRFGHRNSSAEFTPSPRPHGNNSFQSQRRSYTPGNNRSMNNPGGSDNIQDYIHPSMLEDPWKNLQPKPMMRQY